LALYEWLGIKGIVPSLVAISVLSLIITRWFSKRIPVEKVLQSYRETLRKGGGMVKLGLFTVGSGLISTLTLFLVRSFILQKSDVATVGLFQASWSISNLYLGAVLTAMGADYFPRLCGLKDNDAQIVRFVNQQTRFVLVVSTPIIVGMMLITTPVIHLLFSSAFTPAIDLMRLQILGTFMKVLVWPTGFVLLSKGKGFLFLLVESTWFIAYYVITMLLWPLMGLNAAGVGFVGAYLIYLPLVLILVKPLCALTFDLRNKVLTVIFFLFVASAFFLVRFLTGWTLILAGIVLFTSCLVLSGFEFNQFLPTKEWIPKFKKLFRG
jgi:antigen flippase